MINQSTLTVRAASKHGKETSDIERLATELRQTLKCSEIFARILALRGIKPETARDFLYPKIESLSDPFNLQDMGKAVERIIEAVKAKEKIAVYGDYDVDGTTGAFVLSETFRWLKIPIETHIPHRTRDGYGVQKHTLEKMKEEGVSLVITVDCGIRAFDEIEWAKNNGIDIIVTDHHQPDTRLPAALAVINPHRSDCNAGLESLTGVGVAFKLAQALLSKSKISYDLRQLLPFVALGMIADMTNLEGEARTIVKLGFDEIYNSKNFGLAALCEICLSGETLTSTDVGFQLAPRINAAGRLGESQAVIELFNSSSMDEARRLAIELDVLNDDRKRIQYLTIEKAEEEAEKQILEAGGITPDFLVLCGYDWHRGIIGIVASQIAGRYKRPVLVFSEDSEGVLTGSGRSYGNFPLLDALESAADLFITFGGHRAACGAKIERSKLEALRIGLNDFAREFLGSGEFIEPEIREDLLLEPASITLQLAKELKLLEPFGRGNAEPLFKSYFPVESPPQILKGKHLKFSFPSGDSAGGRASARSLTALWWSAAEAHLDTNWNQRDAIETVYKIQTNTWKGATTVQICIEKAQLY
jgi:single-stranded-DNA-specific exonuclease